MLKHKIIPLTALAAFVSMGLAGNVVAAGLPIRLFVERAPTPTGYFFRRLVAWILAAAGTAALVTAETTDHLAGPSTGATYGRQR